MKTVHAYKAQGFTGTTVESATIIIDHEFPSPKADMTTEQVDAAFRVEAAKILDALGQLPGGTLYQMLLLMLQKYPCRYVVPQSVEEV